MSPPERLARTGSYSLMGSGFSALAALALTVLVGNGLGTYGTGLFFQAVGIFTISSQVLRLGTNSSIVKMISEQRAFGRGGESWRTILIAIIPVTVLSAFTAILIGVFSAPLARWLGGGTEQSALEELLVAMAPFIVLFTVLTVLNTALRMVRGVGIFILMQSVFLPLSRLFVVAFAIAIASDTLGVFRAWTAPIPVWLLVAVLLLLRPVVADWRLRNRAAESTRRAAAAFWRFSSSRAVGASFETALQWSDVLIVAALASPAEAGIYAVATRTIRAGQVVDSAMRVAVSPTISEMLARSELVAARTLHTAVTRAMILANWPYYLLLATMGPAVLGLFGPGFEAGSTVLLILAGAMMASSAAGMLQSILLQGGKSSWQMYNKGIALAISIGLNLLLVPTLGMLGAALTWVTGLVVETSIAVWQVHRRMGVSLEPKKLLLAMSIPMLVFGLGGATLRIVFGADLSTLAIGTAILGSLYLGILWALRARLGIEGLWSEIPVVGKYLTRIMRSST